MIAFSVLTKYKIDVDAWADWQESSGEYVTTEPVQLVLPMSTPMETLTAKYWTSDARNRIIVVRPGYAFRVSGPTFNTPTLRLAGFVHDIMCSQVDGRRPVIGYFRRHRFYRQIAINQGCGKVRAVTHFGALCAFNWLHDRLQNG